MIPPPKVNKLMTPSLKNEGFKKNLGWSSRGSESLVTSSCSHHCQISCLDYKCLVATSWIFPKYLGPIRLEVINYNKNISHKKREPEVLLVCQETEYRMHHWVRSFQLQHLHPDYIQKRILQRHEYWSKWESHLSNSLSSRTFFHHRTCIQSCCKWPKDIDLNY